MCGTFSGLRTHFAQAELEETIRSYPERSKLPISQRKSGRKNW